MNGQLAQIAALVIHANAAARRGDDPDAIEGNSTFRYCGQTQFHATTKRMFWGQKRRLIAQSPAGWLRHLVDRGLKRTWLSLMSREAYFDPDRRLKDRTSVAFAGGGPIWIATSEPARGEAFSWLANWAIDTEANPKDRPWTVTYEAWPEAMAYPTAKLGLASETLEKALTDIRAFALEHGETHWPKTFDRALSALDGQPAETFHPDIAPVGALPEPAQNLLVAAQIAWVFGGMGSWNDTHITQEDGYDAVSDGLFQAVCAAIIEACNAGADL